jgi:ABC-type antimicrobial peptide transport system permease subunit
MVVTMPKPRVSNYETSSYDLMKKRVVAYMTQIEEALGYFPIHIGSELLHDFRLYSIGLHFLGLLFNLITLLLIVISVLLIYSLLMITVETKTFEIGVMRMVGLNKTGIIINVIIQSLMFVIPSVLLAFIATIPCLHVVSDLFRESLKLDISLQLSLTTILQALVVGIVIPLASAVIPIRVAL